MKKLYLAVCVGAIFAAAQLSASALTVTVDRVSGYYSHDGGEFNISPGGGSAFVSGVTDNINNRYGNPGYESFCMQVGENVAIPGTYSAYTSQLDDQGNALTLGVAYLYSQFAAGTLSGYNYTPGAGRQASAWALQNAIWYLQGEFNTTSHTAAGELAIVSAFTENYLDLVNGLFTDPTVASGGAYGVSILNLYNGNIQYQSQLYVPDGGVTAILLGLALAVMGLVSRKWRLSR